MKRLPIATAFALAAGSAFAGTVSRLAVDEDGKPLEGVNVEGVYQTYDADQIMGFGASIKAETKTGPDGRYAVSIDHLPPGEHAAHAYTVVDNGGRPTNIDLVPENRETFAGNADTVRNFSGGYYEFTEDDPYGNGGIFVLTTRSATSPTCRRPR